MTAPLERLFECEQTSTLPTYISNLVRFITGYFLFCHLVLILYYESNAYKTFTTVFRHTIFRGAVVRT